MKKAYYILFIAIFLALGTVGFAQDKDKDKNKKKEFCSQQNNWSNGNKVSVSDLREKTIAASNMLKVDSKNGRIVVKGAERSDVLVRACVRVWAESKADATSIAKRVTIATSPNVRSENTPDKNWSVSYEIHVPKSTNLDLQASNGRITISSVKGQMKFLTRNGRITLDDVSGDVAGETRNGRITVKLVGNSWQGNGLNVKTRNGRISLYIPSNYSANVEAGTNNGRFRSDFRELSIEEKDGKKRRKHGPHKVSASINGGGAPVRVVTNNGRVSIRSSSIPQ